MGRSLDRRGFLGCLWGLLAAVLCLPEAMAVTKEYQLMSVILWRLAQFVEWPASAFASPDSPLIIAVLGENPFGTALELATRGETARGRKIVIGAQASDAIDRCHILFVSSSEKSRFKDILRSVSGKHILTVSDGEGFSRAGGMVDLFIDSGRAAMRVNLRVADAAGLAFDARVLRMAEVVK